MKELFLCISSLPHLWKIVQAYKSKVAVEWIEYVKANCPERSAKIWQKKYYERMVRVDTLDQVRRSIRANPGQVGAQVSYVRWEKLYERMGWERPQKALMNSFCMIFAAHVPCR